MSLVWQYYPDGGGELLTALALADHAHDDGTNIRPSVRHVAKKTRQSERTVQRYLARMRDKKWLLTVRNGKGGRNYYEKRGYVTEYRINPAWISNPDNLSPLLISGQERVSSEVGKGDNRGSKRVTPVSPKSPTTVSEPTTTDKMVNEQVVVDLDNLIWPHFLLDSNVHSSALQLLQKCPEADRQNVLHEISGLADRGTVRSPIGLLHKLVDLAKRGLFIPAAALEYQRKLEKESKNIQSQIEEKKRLQASRSPRAKETARGHISELLQKLNT